MIFAVFALLMKENVGSDDLTNNTESTKLTRIKATFLTPVTASNGKNAQGNSEKKWAGTC